MIQTGDTVRASLGPYDGKKPVHAPSTPRMQPVANPVTTLRDAIAHAFPERADVRALEIDGVESQAWAAYARILSKSPTELAACLAPVLGVTAAGPLLPEDIDAEVLALVPYNFCQKQLVLPVRWSSGALEVATHRPGDEELRERLSFVVNKPIRWLLAPPSQIEDAILAAYSREAVGFLQQFGAASGAGALDDNAIVRLARELMTRAVRARASDLHVQPYLGTTVVRIRVDGILRRLTVLPDAVAGMLIRHIKARGSMDPTTTLVPQDGRMTLVVDGRDYALRLSTLPVSGGERLVIRFLLQSQAHRLASAGFSLAALQTLRRALARPSGLVVFTGPTGSGKTSTLYAMLNEINRSDINIITVENPVEYRIAGISQVEVNDKANRTFGNALRSILRQDPDVVLIGEIRDSETAEIATQAALTGHLVLTTLHTTDALTAIPRLLDLGVQASILADALVLVAAQRLCRRLCPHCRVPVQEPLQAEERAFLEVTRNIPSHRAVGCAHCEYTGFHGRLPIVDIIEMGGALRDAVGAGETRLSELSACREGGLRALAASGSLRVISGDTTVRELMDAVGPVFWTDLAAHYGSKAPEALTSIEAIPGHSVAGFGVLLIGGDGALAQALHQALLEDGLRLVHVADAESARRALSQDADIGFVVGDLPDGVDVEAAVAILRENRRHISWARLPAAVLVPLSLAQHEDVLRASGVMATLCAKPVQASDLCEHIRRAQAR